MAYEISEGAAAGAMWIPYNTLKSLKLDSIKNIKNAMQLIYSNLNNNAKVIGSSSEKNAYKAWLNPSKNFGKANDGKGWDARVTAIIHGYSSALGAKDWMKKHGEKKIDLITSDKIYLTGGQWDPAISWLKVNVNKWADYNSSDLVILRGHCYYGISLKKKDTPTSADPPMINKSIMELLESVSDTGSKSSDSHIKKIMNELVDAKADFFGKTVVSATVGGKPLSGSTGITNSKVGRNKAFFTKIRHPKKSKGWISLIDLKGPAKLRLATVQSKEVTDRNTKEKNIVYQQYVGKVKSGVIECVSTDPSDAISKKILDKKEIQHLFAIGKTYEPENMWLMRQHVNGTLGRPNTFYNIILKILQKTDAAKVIGSVLLSSVLKTELKEQIDKNDPMKVNAKGLVQKCANCHFGFALITAAGKYKDGKMRGNITHANVKENPTIQAVLSMLSESKTVSRTQWQIKETMTTHPITKKNVTLSSFKREEADTAGKEPPAKLFFTIGIKGKSNFHSVLSLEVRYKGTFSPWPQFLGGMSDSFMQLLYEHEKNNPRAKKAMKDCGA